MCRSVYFIFEERFPAEALREVIESVVIEELLNIDAKNKQPQSGTLERRISKRYEKMNTN
jgi:hypothetical protein